MTGLVNAAREIKSTGTFHYLAETPTSPELNAFLRE